MHCRQLGVEFSTRVSVDEDDREAGRSRGRGRSSRVTADILQDEWFLVERDGKQGGR